MKEYRIVLTALNGLFNTDANIQRKVTESFIYSKGKIYDNTTEFKEVIEPREFPKGSEMLTRLNQEFETELSLFFGNDLPEELKWMEKRAGEIQKSLQDLQQEFRKTEFRLHLTRTGPWKIRKLPKKKIRTRADLVAMNPPQGEATGSRKYRGTSEEPSDAEVSASESESADHPKSAEEKDVVES